MVVRVYVSGISGSKEVKKRQQRVLMILDSKSIKYEIIDIAEPGRESDKEFVQENGKKSDSKLFLPQIFSDDTCCGDYDDFDMANELDKLEEFLKVEKSADVVTTNNSVAQEEVTKNGDAMQEQEEKREENEEISGNIEHTDAPIVAASPPEELFTSS